MAENDLMTMRQLVSFRTQSGIQSVARKDILYLESKSHLLIIHTTENEYTIYEKLSAVLEKLGGADEKLDKAAAARRK